MSDLEEHYLVVTLKPAGQAADIMINTEKFEFDQFRRFKCDGLQATGEYINTLNQPFFVIHTISILDLFQAAHPDRFEVVTE